jgi:hypothetical protein
MSNDDAIKLLKAVENSRTTPIDGNLCRTLIAAHLRQCEHVTEATTFLDRMASRIDGFTRWDVAFREAAADCRVMAKKLRGET